jgi:nucleoid DNA-binding protein
MARKKAALEKALTKSQLMGEIAEDTGLSKKDVAAVIDALGEEIVRHLKGINPFTGEEIMIKAKPASRAVRIRPLKALKDAI